MSRMTQLLQSRSRRFGWQWQTLQNPRKCPGKWQRRGACARRQVAAKSGHGVSWRQLEPQNIVHLSDSQSSREILAEAMGEVQKCSLWPAVQAPGHRGNVGGTPHQKSAFALTLSKFKRHFLELAANFGASKGCRGALCHCTPVPSKRTQASRCIAVIWFKP